MKKHVHKYINCDLCEIAKTTKRKVFYRGSTTPKYLFIGEAPGASDYVLGTPFSRGSSAGKVFSNLIKDARVSNYGVSFVIACHPSLPEKIRKPTEEEVCNCKHRLDDLVETVLPEFYIALGKFAKTNPPSGIAFHLELDAPKDISRSGGVGSVRYKRNKHILQRFIKETNG